MNDTTRPDAQNENGTSKETERHGFVEPPARPVAEDLRFIVKESIRLGLRVIGEIDRALQKLSK